jgi:hypothetical protein
MPWQICDRQGNTLDETSGVQLITIIELCESTAELVADVIFCTTERVKGEAVSLPT